MTALPAHIARHFGAETGALGVAVSGGGDSLALLHLMADWGGAPLRCVTVDHGLRAASAAEASQVAAHCAGVGIAHDTLTWQGWDEQGNLSAAARRARYALMADWAQAHGLSGVVLGHTRDDVSETLLMRLARRAGVDGLAAMPACRAEGPVTLHRPLLEASRAELRAYLDARGMKWIEDPTNTDGRYRRTQARRALDLLAPVGITTDALADVAGHLAEARGTLGHYAAAEARALVRVQHGDLEIAADAFLALRGDIARRILAAGLRWITGAGYAPRGPEVERLLASLAEGQGGTLAGCRVTAVRGTIRLAREFAAASAATAAPGAPWDGRWRVTGPETPGAQIRALGPEGRKACTCWRDSGLPVHSAEALPAVWQGDTLIAAPRTGMANGWVAEPLRGAADLQAMLLSH